MGKRSRKGVRAQPGSASGGRASASGGGSASRSARTAPVISPDAGPIERAKVSWKVAGEAAPGVIKEPGMKPRATRTGMFGPSLKDRGPRPAALWGSAPISEFAILVGVVVLAIGLIRGPGSPAIGGGLIMISIAALEFAGREHLRGYRSHSLFLAMITVIILHFVLAFAVGAHTARSSVFIALDVVVFVLLASALHKQYSIVRLDTAAPKRSR